VLLTAGLLVLTLGEPIAVSTGTPPRLKDLLASAGRYVTALQENLAVLVADEDYTQVEVVDRRATSVEAAQVVILAVEDPLSEAVARRLLTSLRPELVPVAVLGLRGRDSVMVKCRELNRSAAHIPVLVPADQDVPARCPPAIIEEWLRGAPRHLIFRVAVMEVVADPKQTLVNLARASRVREIQRDIVPSAGSTAQVGTAYNLRLRQFVESTWDPLLAAASSVSLRRTIDRLRDYRAPGAGAGAVSI
jgi:hypothetical protein